MHLRPLGHLSRVKRVVYFRDVVTVYPFRVTRCRGEHEAIDSSKLRRSLENPGGESGIRTHGTLAGTPDFESGTFGHSVISPRRNLAAMIATVNAVAKRLFRRGKRARALAPRSGKG